jgi:hypothetical protein
LCSLSGDSELEPAFTRALSESLDASVVRVAVPVEDHLRDSFFFCPAGQLFAKGIRRINIETAYTKCFGQSGGTADNDSGIVVDEVRLYAMPATIHD